MASIKSWEVYALGLTKFMPKRGKTGGTTPSIRSKEVSQPGKEVETQWIYPTIEPNKTKIRNLLAACIKIATEVLFECQLYKFGRVVKKPKTGVEKGPQDTIPLLRLPNAECQVGLRPRELSWKRMLLR